jgi:hypothetical protein
MLLSKVTFATGALFLASVLVACGGSDNGASGTDTDSGDGQPETGMRDAGGGPRDAAGDGTDGAMGLDAEDGDGGDGGGFDSGGDGPFVSGAHAPEPQVVDLGGAVLTAPKVQLIVYAADPNATDVDLMVRELTMTTTWNEQTSEYGVGALTELPTIQIAGTPPTTLNDQGSGVTPFEQTLVDNTSGATPSWGPADASTIYAFLLPLGTNIQSYGSCCSDFLGYHYEVPVGAVNVSYAIICTCGTADVAPLTELQGVTTTVSHELVEAATDPFVASDPAFEQTDDNDIVWTAFTGGEVADMCEYNADTNYTPTGSTYMVQRSWSDAAATAGTNPCVPVPTTDPFFQSVAVLPDTVTIEGVSTKGITIPVGSSKTIDVQLSSSAKTSGSWTVTAYDYNDYLGYPANTTVSLNKTKGSNGDVLRLTIQVNSADKNLGGEGFVLVSDLGKIETLSVGAVGN